MGFSPIVIFSWTKKSLPGDAGGKQAILNSKHKKNSGIDKSSNEVKQHTLG